MSSCNYLHSLIVDKSENITSQYSNELCHQSKLCKLQIRSEACEKMNIMQCL